MILQSIAAIAVDLWPLFLASLYGLFLLLKIIDSLLQTEQHFNIVQIIQLFGMIVEDLDT